LYIIVELVAEPKQFHKYSLGKMIKFAQSSECAKPFMMGCMQNHSVTSIYLTGNLNIDKRQRIRRQCGLHVVVVVVGGGGERRNLGFCFDSFCLVTVMALLRTITRNVFPCLSLLCWHLKCLLG